MKIRFQWLGRKTHIPRSVKQKEKEKIKKIFQLPSVNLFNRIGQSGNIYSPLDPEETPIYIFEAKLSEKTNYFIGKINLKKEEIYFLIDIGYLITISGEYHIFPENKLTAFLYRNS